MDLVSAIIHQAVELGFMKVEVDYQADAAYITISNHPVSKTIGTNDIWQYDLDVEGNVVGIEILTLHLMKTIEED